MSPCSPQRIVAPVVDLVMCNELGDLDPKKNVPPSSYFGTTRCHGFVWSDPTDPQNGRIEQRRLEFLFTSFFLEKKREEEGQEQLRLPSRNASSPLPSTRYCVLSCQTSSPKKNVSPWSLGNPRLSGMSGLASNPTNRQIAWSSGASEHQTKTNFDFFYFFFSKNLKNMV